MENQHRKIAGYRELGAEEIDLMNRCKAAGAALLAVQADVLERLRLANSALNSPGQSSEQIAEAARFDAAEPFRWAAIAKTDIQTGIMALVRAIAQPAGGI